MTNVMRYDSNDFSSMVLSTVKSSIFHKPNQINNALKNNGGDNGSGSGYFYDYINDASMTTILDYDNDNKFIQFTTANYSSSTLDSLGSFIEQQKNESDMVNSEKNSANNYWALLALILVFGTACGNILVCLAIYYEKRLQNVTNYFLASLALTDLMVAVLVMPLGILTLYKGIMMSFELIIFIILKMSLPRHQCGNNGGGRNYEKLIDLYMYILGLVCKSCLTF